MGGWATLTGKYDAGLSLNIEPGAPILFAHFAKRVGDGDHRCTLLTRALQESARNPTRETTVESGLPTIRSGTRVLREITTLVLR